MGGGGDSRIPSILREYFNANGLQLKVNVICRTYSFDPVEGHEQIKEWMLEYMPDLIIGESLGTLHALRLRKRPTILISPALNAPFYFGALSWMVLIPGVTRLFDRIYKPKDGDRQPLHFAHKILRKYLSHRKRALADYNVDFDQSYPVHAFIGTSDHYRKSGVVSIRSWKKHFGDTYTLYAGSHFTEEEYIYSLIIPKVVELLVYNK